VDHPLPAPDSLVRPWRTAAYVAAGIAVVELLLLLFIGGGKLVGWASARVELAAQERALAPVRNPQQATTRKQAPLPAAKRPRTKTVVLVLNGNGRTGAAAAAASRVHSRGYKIGAVTNARELVPRSIVMYRPGFAGEGKRLGRDLRVRLVTPLDGMRAKNLGRAHLVFIVGP
jgi:hypothetical protein